MFPPKSQLSPVFAPPADVWQGLATLANRGDFVLFLTHFHRAVSAPLSTAKSRTADESVLVRFSRGWVNVSKSQLPMTGSFQK